MYRKRTIFFQKFIKRKILIFENYSWSSFLKLILELAFLTKIIQVSAQYPNCDLIKVSIKACLAEALDFFPPFCTVLFQINQNSNDSLWKLFSNFYSLLSQISLVPFLIQTASNVRPEIIRQHLSWFSFM